MSANKEEYSHLHLFFLEKSFKSASWTPLLFVFPEDRKSSKGGKGSGSLLIQIANTMHLNSGALPSPPLCQPHYPPKAHPQLFCPDQVPER